MVWRFTSGLGLRLAWHRANDVRMLGVWGGLVRS